MVDAKVVHNHHYRMSCIVHQVAQEAQILEYAQRAEEKAEVQLAYLQIPAATLRGFADSLFPGFAKDAVADAVSGTGHRFMAGHDLLLDVMPRFATEPASAFHQAGHILLTDFPTKAGIPIPGFSHSGLGEFLVNCGIPKGWMCMNIMDAGVGILAVAEGIPISWPRFPAPCP